MITVRLATPKDSVDLANWRNDLVTRMMSKNTAPITKNEHIAWLKKMLKSNNHYILMCLDKEGNKVGVVRFDLEENSAVVSINLNPNMRGMGLATTCLKKALCFANSIFPTVDIFNAEIKNTNISSIRTFINAGFYFQTEKDGIRYYLMDNASGS